MLREDVDDDDEVGVQSGKMPSTIRSALDQSMDAESTGLSLFVDRPKWLDLQTWCCPL